MLKLKLAKLDCKCIQNRNTFLEGTTPNVILKLRPGVINCSTCYDTGITSSPWWEMEPRAYETGLYFKE